MADRKIYNPETLSAPPGEFCHVARVKTQELVFIAGSLSIDVDGSLVGVGDFERQCDQVFANIKAVLDAEELGWGNIVQFTTYLAGGWLIPVFVEYRKRRFPTMFENGAYPPNTLLVVDRLVKEEFLIEVQPTAAV